MLCISQTIAIILFLGLIVFTIFYVYPIILEAKTGNEDLEKKRVIHIPFNFIIPQYNARIDYDLRAEYPHGTLIVDDPIKFSGVADASNFPQRVASFKVWFQNALKYPIVQDYKGITESIQIIFDKTNDNSKLIANETLMLWKLEGRYEPKMELILENGEKFVTHLPILPYNPPPSDMAIIVHPKSLMAQNVTNKASIGLAIAAYFLGFVGALDIIYRLWTGTS